MIGRPQALSPAAGQADCEVGVEAVDPSLLGDAGPGGDYLEEIRRWVPNNELGTLREFWHDHNKRVNQWVHVARPF
jgi:hypothetical protein